MTVGRRLLFAAVCAVAVASVYAAQPVLGQIGSDLGMADGQLGWIVAAGQLGYLVGLATLVPLGDLLDRRRLIAGHLALAGTGTALAATATRAWVLLVGLAVAGLFAVVVQTTVAYAAALSTPEERGRTLGAVTSGVVLGILGARVAAGALAAAWGWRGVYVTLSVLLATLALLLLRTLPPDVRADRVTYRQVSASLRGLFRERLFVSRGLIAFFLFASFSALWGGLALPLAAGPWHLGTTEIGLFGLAGLVGALGAARAGRWADAGFASPVTGGALALLAASWLAVGQATWSLWLLVIGVVVLDFAVQAVHVSNQHLLTTAHPDRTSSVVGGYMLFYSLGSALGATTTTAAFATAGWPGSSALGATFAVAALAVWATDRRTRPFTGAAARTRPTPSCRPPAS
ncbi:MFS transporter [Streptomyces millisiae]|uniref:MFS transporter n=1 Tax=Streptomyces millisiae TaxID=3075542 RepID=A0ABU2LQC9_9ACTN|nr:MFS transporter [Streptomyces sp. DSM 44918]MDT0319715.1 MFS transporter [Streptomyces sp. DSM 44918]